MISEAHFDNIFQVEECKHIYLALQGYFQKNALNASESPLAKIVFMGDILNKINGPNVTK